MEMMGVKSQPKPSTMASSVISQELKTALNQELCPLVMCICQNHDHNENEAELALKCVSPVMKFSYAKVKVSKKLVVNSF